MGGGGRSHDQLAFPPLSEPHEPVQRELTALDREIEKQTVQLREWQMQELLTLRQQLHAPEREVQQRHQQEVTMRATAGHDERTFNTNRAPPPSSVCAGLPEAEGDRSRVSGRPAEEAQGGVREVSATSDL